MKKQSCSIRVFTAALLLSATMVAAPATAVAGANTNRRANVVASTQTPAIKVNRLIVQSRVGPVVLPTLIPGKRWRSAQWLVWEFPAKPATTLQSSTLTMIRSQPLAFLLSANL